MFIFGDNMFFVILGIGFGIMFSVLQAISRLREESEKIPLWKAFALSFAWPIVLAYFMRSKKSFDVALGEIVSIFKKPIS